MPDAHPPTYYVLFHSPGPEWDAGKSYDQQPRFGDHVDYMDECFAAGVIVLSGPFLDAEGGMAASGMAIFQCADIAQARALAEADPTVESGMLTVSVKPWAAVFHH